jgi:hypothetical protein
VASLRLAPIWVASRRPDGERAKHGADGHPARAIGADAEVDWTRAAAQERIVSGRPPEPVALRCDPVDVTEPDRLS